MAENFNAKDCLTAKEYADNNGLDLDTVKKAVEYAKGLVVKNGSHQTSIIVKTGNKKNYPRIHPCEAAQKKFQEIINKIQKAGK